MNELSTIPIKRGEKVPVGPWEEYMHRLPHPEELCDWANAGHSLGVVCGNISGGLEVIDFDDPSFLKPWLRQLRDSGFDIERLGCIVQTRKGYHVYVRSPHVEGSQKLAMPASGRGVLIETRGEGGYAVTPSDQNTEYQFLIGDHSTIPEVTADEKELLYSVARSFDQRTTLVHPPSEFTGEGRPGDDFNSRADWPELLESEGWSMLREMPDGSSQWTRPGKSDGVSATLGYKGLDIFYVFTSSTELEANKGYSKFSFYAMTKHGGDFQSAAAELSAQGFGTTAKAGATTNQLTSLVDTILPNIDMFQSREGEGYAVIEGGRALPIDSEQFAHYITGKYREEHGNLPRENTNREARAYFSREASIRGRIEDVYIRSGFHKDSQTLVVDLAQSPARYVHIDKTGWKLSDNPLVFFKRTSGMLPLPTPKREGSIEALRPYVNVASEEDWVLLQSWVLSTLNPFGEFPILLLKGDAASGKSTIIRLLRKLVDPTMPEFQYYPKSMEVLQQHAIHNFMLAYDNLSGISNEISDVLCTLATGGGFATRTLYTTAGRSAFSFKRPVVLASIDNIARRGDLVSRSISLHLAEVSAQDMVSTSEILRRFSNDEGAILGGVYSAASAALRNYAETDVSGNGYRLADFVRWVQAATPALNVESDEFIRMLGDSFVELHEDIIEQDTVAMFIMEFMEHRESVTKSTSELYELLSMAAPEHIRRSKDFPQSPSRLGVQLNRLKPTLRRLGIEASYERQRSKRIWRLERMDK